jgi:predicted DNA-binding antitoxin AbrB/MazE fold protein
VNIYIYHIYFIDQIKVVTKKILRNKKYDSNDVCLDGPVMKPTKKINIKNGNKINTKVPIKISKNAKNTKNSQNIKNQKKSKLGKGKNGSFLDGLKSVFKIDDTPLGQPRCPVRDVVPLPIKYEKYNEL